MAGVGRAGRGPVSALRVPLGSPPSVPPPFLPLGDDEVLVLFVPGDRRDWDALVPPPQVEAMARMRDPRARATRTATHGALRAALSAFTGAAPHDIRYDRTCARCGAQHGKPRLRPEIGLRGVHFNCAHTDEIGVLGFSRSEQVGVDIEPIARASDIEASIDIALAAREREELRGVAGDARARRLVRAWTMKEAFLKMVGWGLAVEPHEIDLASVASLPHYAPPAALSPLNTRGVTFVELDAPAGMSAVLAVAGPPCRVVQMTV